MSKPLALWKQTKRLWPERLKSPHLPLRGLLNGQILYTHEDWLRDTKALYPVRFFVWQTIPVAIGRAKSWLKKLVT